MNGPRIPTLPPTVDVAHRRRLTDQIFRLLNSNGSFARGVYDGLKAEDIASGGMRQLYRQRPFDGIRCEMGGTTLTVEITNLHQGEQDDADALRFATYDYMHFCSWFFSLLSQSGQLPQPPSEQGLPADLIPVQTSASLIRPDLRSAPHHRHKGRGGKR